MNPAEFLRKIYDFLIWYKNAIGTGSSKSWRRMKNSIVRKWLNLLRVYVFSPD
jgi:hypothetical protein